MPPRFELERTQNEQKARKTKAKPKEMEKEFAADLDYGVEPMH